MAVKFEQALLDYPQQRAGAARQPDSVDQSDRRVPINLRQSGPTPVEMLISTRVRKSPYWHLAYEAGCWRATRRPAAAVEPQAEIETPDEDMGSADEGCDGDEQAGEGVRRP